VADGEIILDEIARERALLDRLEREAAEARARLNAHEAGVPPDTASSVTIAAPTTPAPRPLARSDGRPRYSRQLSTHRWPHGQTRWKWSPRASAQSRSK
jgi:hypothetical protein